MHKITSSLIGILCFFIVVPSVQASFKDVIEKSHFHDSVEYFTNLVPIINEDKEYFRPLDTITKAEFYKLLFASTGYTPDSTKTIDIPYHDITGEEWFAPYINKALDTGILTFSENDPNFHPGDPITRMDSIEKIINTYNLNIDLFYDNSIRYKDSDNNVANFAYDLQLFSDYQSRYFSPEKAINRAQTVRALYQIHQYIPQAGVTSDLVSQESFLIMLDVWDTIMNEYVENESIDEEKLIHGAISGMVQELDDPYSTYLEPDIAGEYNDSLNGESFGGIGIYINSENDEIVVITPLKGSPAEKAGVKPNDIIMEIDNIPVKDITLNEAINMLRGPSGSDVEIKIKRNSINKTISITRSQIDIPYVESEMINEIAIIYYYQFTSNSHSQFINEIETLMAQNPEGFILDMRNNPGGYLSSSEQLISHFIPNGETYAILEFSDGYVQNFKTNGPADLSEYPVVILLNEGSASASEITALALKEFNDTPIVGMTSYGKGKIQEIVNYNDGSTLKLSTAKWFSANGTYIDGIGVAPDYIVEITDRDLELDSDPQLKKALTLF